MSNATDRTTSLAGLATARTNFLIAFDALMDQQIVKDAGGGAVPQLVARDLEISADFLVERARHLKRVHLKRG